MHRISPCHRLLRAVWARAPGTRPLGDDAYNLLPHFITYHADHQCVREWPSNGTRRSTFWWLALAAVRTPGSGPWAVMTLRQPSYTARAVIYGPAQSSRPTGAVIGGAAEEHLLQRASDALSADLWRETCTTLQLLDLASWRQQPSRLCFSV